MNTKPVQQQDVMQHRSCGRYVSVIATAIAVVGLTLGGCTKETPEVPPIEVKSVEVEGMTIDHDSTPSEVTYALLRAMVADQRAARAGDKDAQKAAMDKIFGLAAYPAIEKAVLGRLNATIKDKNAKVTSLGDERALRLYDHVNYWTPIAGHYLASVDDDFDSMADRMREQIVNDQAIVHCLLAHDLTATAPADREEIVLDVRLMKVKAGPLAYWRVAKLDYPGKKALKLFETPAASLPAHTD